MQISGEKYYRIIQSILNKYKYSSIPEEVRKAFEKELRIRLSWNTNSLEGNTLTLEETVDALEYDEVRSGHTYSEYTEAKTAYQANCELSFTDRKEIDLELLHRINGIIMGTDGAFRTRQVYVGSIAEVAWMPARPEEISEKMEQWLQNVRENRMEEDIARKIRRIAELHLQFEMIHPFQDGNGRTGRFVMDQMLLNEGWMPAIILNQSKYRQAFRIYERNCDTALMEYCIAAGVAKTCEILEDICRKLTVPEVEVLYENR